MSYVRHTTVAAVCLPVLVIILWVPALEVSCCVHMFSGLLLLLCCVLISIACLHCWSAGAALVRKCNQGAKIRTPITQRYPGGGVYDCALGLWAFNTTGAMAKR